MSEVVNTLIFGTYSVIGYVTSTIWSLIKSGGIVAAILAVGLSIASNKRLPSDVELPSPMKERVEEETSRSNLNFLGNVMVGIAAKSAEIADKIITEHKIDDYYVCKLGAVRLTTDHKQVKYYLGFNNSWQVIDRVPSFLQWH